MPSISVISPWSGETSHLLPDYFAAVQGVLVALWTRVKQEGV